MNKLIKITAICMAAILVLFSGCGIMSEKKAVTDAYVENAPKESVPGVTSSQAAETATVPKKKPQATTHPKETVAQPTPEIVSESENADEVSNELTCTLSVKCDTIFENIDKLKDGKAEFIPENGVIFEETAVAFTDGESVFDVLLRKMKENKIHLEFSKTPMYNSIYIEGIGNIYEFDCGELSGWMYKVNGKAGECDSSGYKLENGDVIEWVFTCNLGKDIGR